MIAIRSFWLLMLLIPVLAAAVAHGGSRCSEWGLVTRPLTECEWRSILPEEEWQSILPDLDACTTPVKLTGTHGDDRLTGNAAADVLIGRRGNDWLIGNGGDDMLRGGDDDDFLSGGPGNDELRGWIGDDTYTGGADADRFSFNPWEHGDKIITDFEPCAGDRIVLVVDLRAPWPSIADILASAVQQGEYTVYELREGLTVETDTPLAYNDFEAR